MLARWGAAQGGGGKIVALRAEALRDQGVAATCLLAALGRELDEADGEYVRAYVGALLVLGAFRELTQIRTLLTAKE